MMKTFKIGVGERRAGGKFRRKVQRDADDAKPRKRESDRLEVALLCAAAGLPVFALHPGRHPRIDVLQDATTDVEKIRQMLWGPKAKIGIALSPKVVVLVVEGTAGRKELKKLEDEK